MLQNEDVSNQELFEEKVKIPPNFKHTMMICRNLYHNGKKAQSREGKEGSQSPS